MMLFFLIYSPFQLHVSETHSSASLFSGWDTTEFDNISHIPIKTSNDFYTLGDIIANDQSLNGEHVNIQAVVKSVSKIGAHLGDGHKLDTDGYSFVSRRMISQISLDERWRLSNENQFFKDASC